jgi:hypothetical protein
VQFRREGVWRLAGWWVTHLFFISELGFGRRECVNIRRKRKGPLTLAGLATV